jgi:ABC-type multidrug transport system ATPase subunit
MASAIIQVSNLVKSFGNHPILQNVSFEIREGERYGLVGLNGAGKTTLIRLLLGVLKPSGGAIAVLGGDPWSHDAFLHRRMGVVLEHDGFWGNLTFEQNMKIFAAAKGISWKEATGYIQEYWSGTDLYKNKKAVKLFSRGQRMQCALARAFLGWPAVYFFDEPVVALDVGAYDHLKGLVKVAGDRRATFLISSHQLEAIDDLCGRVGILQDRCVTELEGETGKSGNHSWVLEADRNEACAAILRDVCVKEPSWNDGEWHISISDPSATVPLLVRRLVEAGCEVRKIAPAIVTGFSHTIRRYYRAVTPGSSP